MDKLELLQSYIDESRRIVFFGGAGVSTESGIPDFRSVDGLYNEKYDYPPEEILSGDFLRSRPDEFYRFYRDKLVVTGARPNAAHMYLAKLEAAGKLTAVITQNIDGLHQAAGSRNVLELHGTLLKNSCMRCRKKYPAETVQGAKDVPRCSCGGIIRPDIVLYGESLDEDVLEKAVSNIESADMLIVGGTSLVVYPAAGLVRYFRGKHLAIINMSPTGLDKSAELCIQGKIGEVFSSLRV